MNGWWKRGAVALVLGGLLGVTGLASADVAPSPRPIPVVDKGKGPEKAQVGKGPEGKGPEGKGKPEDKGKPDDKGKPEDKDAGADAAAAPAESEADQKAREEKHKAKKEARKAKSKEEREALKKKVSTALKGQPMATAMKQELERHARRLARLERVKDLAEEAKDTEATERVQKLLDKENARHEKWMANYDAKTTGAKGAGADGKPAEKAGEK
ncbi:hypothetical protein [Polyangium sp. y55x31]|uniref:hypothetical protein n=1 Tax=Polyangium sp. y55x31 TaxID=3042688 RepID=UPI0024826B51|nr:hypothetical protein [Polyangium sp. y55x31]MDI1479483.1 hypothetical protein [Polyangium sp. y55x31]